MEFTDCWMLQRHLIFTNVCRDYNSKRARMDMYPYETYTEYNGKYCIQQYILLIVCTYHG